MAGGRTRMRWTIALTAVMLAGPAARAGEVRSWVDKEGVVHLTNKPTRSNGAKKKQAAQRPRAEVVEYDEHIDEAADYYKVPEELVRAIIAAESNFDPEAVSHKGAQGLMQLIPPTADEMYVADAFDPRQNIHGGVRYLRYLANMFQGDLVKVIAAYNAGPEAVKKAGGVPRIAETQTYVKKVLRYYYAFKGKG